MKKLSRILVVNDDGFDAPGLKIAEELAAIYADEVWTITPTVDQGAASHAFSISLPVRVTQLEPRRFAIGGTPGDCIAMAVKLLMAQNLPDLVISGVNDGANVADDIAFSGTISGALTAGLFGIPAIALSQASDDAVQSRWETARVCGVRVLDAVLAAPLRPDLCLNVNFPSVPPDEVRGLRTTRQGLRAARAFGIDSRADLRGKAYYWLDLTRVNGQDEPDSDIAALANGAVSITPLRLDRTDDAALPVLAALLKPPA